MSEHKQQLSTELENNIKHERKNEIKRHVDGLPIKEVETILKEVLDDVKETTTYTLKNPD